MKRWKLAFVGGGGYQWTPRILKDIMVKKDIPSIDFYLLDQQVESAQTIRKLGIKMNEELLTDHQFFATSDEDTALQSSDFVIICISTGGLNQMKFDIQIPEKYGIYQTVGDTVGPGGWSRNLRNIPVFNSLADKIEKLAPNAVVVNYTNPMACLTKAFYARTKLRAVGLCHGLFENISAMKELFGVMEEEDIKIRFGGVNHFFWILDFKIRGEDGYALLREKLGSNKRIVDLLQEVHKDEAGFHSNKYLTSELFETFGYFPYVGDRHTCEFLPHLITGTQVKLDQYQIKRTTIEERERSLRNRRTKVEEMINGTREIDYTKSRESAADIVEAVMLGKEFIDIVNVANIGQIPNLPLGAIVETLGVINPLGFTPITAGPLPESILQLVKPHAENSETLYQAATHGDFELALQALYHDPVCMHLDYTEIRKMATELMEANRHYLPQFFS